MSNPSTPEDRFAHVFGTSPEPRRGTEATPGHTHAASADGRGAPSSRRAAREAAASAAEAAPDTATAARPVTVTAPPETEAALPPATVPVSAHGIDDLFTGHATTDTIGMPPPPKNKRRRRIAGWVAFGVVLVVLGGITAGGFWVWNTFEPQIRAVMGWEEPKDYASGHAHGEALVTISSGDNGSAISTTLYKAGVTKTPEAFYDMLVHANDAPTFYPGVYALQKTMTSTAALKALQDPANKRDHTAQLREGLTLDQSVSILSESLGIPAKDFAAAVKKPSDYGVHAKTLEGWLFPATYTFDPGVSAKDVVKTLVDRTSKSLDDAGVPDADRQRILTIASIIQREARFQDDFYKVSRVIENRLSPSNKETFGKLQMDSTAQYGYGEMHDGTVSSSAAALKDDNPWNTYVHTGLPVGPIANPGDVAIDAAMHPADGPWLYFVTVDLDSGKTVFTTNLADHNKAVTQWQKWCTGHPDSGC